MCDDMHIGVHSHIYGHNHAFVHLAYASQAKTKFLSDEQKGKGTKVLFIKWPKGTKVLFSTCQLATKTP